MDNFETWAQSVNAQLMSSYCLSYDDAGIDPETLKLCWRSGDGPSEFVEWIAEKFDLTRLSTGYFPA